MGEQPNQTSPKQPEAAKLDPAAASAALAMAVTSAENASARHAEAVSEKTTATLQRSVALALSGVRERGARSAGMVRARIGSDARQAAVLAVAIGLGWAAGSQALSGGRAVQASPSGTEAAAAMRQNQDDIVRLAGEVDGLKATSESFRQSLEQASTDVAAQNRLLLGRLQTAERTGAAADAKLAAVTGRLDAIERRAADPAQTGSVPDAEAAKQALINGWVLREVYNGGAVVESRNGRLHEVAPGRTLPGIGRVKAVERRGKIWVVVTSKGIIAPPERWR